MYPMEVGLLPLVKKRGAEDIIRAKSSFSSSSSASSRSNWAGLVLRDSKPSVGWQFFCCVFFYFFYAFLYVFFVPFIFKENGDKIGSKMMPSYIFNIAYTIAKMQPYGVGYVRKCNSWSSLSLLRPRFGSWLTTNFLQEAHQKASTQLNNFNYALSSSESCRTGPAQLKKGFWFVVGIQIANYLIDDNNNMQCQRRTI